MILAVETLIRLLMGHAVADFALQTPWIANNKSRHSEPAGYDPKKHGPKQAIWVYVLTAHALIHGSMTVIVTGSTWLGLLEAVSHWMIDFGKCEKWYGIHTDQFLHLLMKLLIVYVYLA